MVLKIREIKGKYAPPAAFIIIKNGREIAPREEEE
jgi:hypothetical protein